MKRRPHDIKTFNQNFICPDVGPWNVNYWFDEHFKFNGPDVWVVGVLMRRRSVGGIESNFPGDNQPRREQQLDCGYRSELELVRSSEVILPSSLDLWEACSSTG